MSEGTTGPWESPKYQIWLSLKKSLDTPAVILYFQAAVKTLFSQNAADHVLTRTSFTDHITIELASLHQHPVKSKGEFKILVLLINIY